MEVNDALYGLKKLAMKDPTVKEALLATRSADNPLKEFCSLSTSYGFPLYEMDLISAGEDAWRRCLCRHAAEHERRRGEFSDAALRR